MTKEALHDGIIMTISSPGHAGDNVVFFGIRLKFFRCINRTSFTFRYLIAYFNVFITNISVYDSLMT